jgi:hypothetical protein
MLAELTFYSSAGLLAYTYLLYPLVLALLPRTRNSQYGPQAPLDAAHGWPRVSVIVAAHDEAKTIARKIRIFSTAVIQARANC